MDDSSLEDSVNDSEKLLRQIMARRKDSMIKLSCVQLQNIKWAKIAVNNISVVVYQRLPHYPGIEK